MRFSRLPARIPALLTGLLASVAADPVRVIFCTDMGNDIDDAMALAMLHSLESRKACKLLGPSDALSLRISSRMMLRACPSPARPPVGGGG